MAGDASKVLADQLCWELVRNVRSVVASETPMKDPRHKMEVDWQVVVEKWVIASVEQQLEPYMPVVVVVVAVVVAVAVFAAVDLWVTRRNERLGVVRLTLILQKCTNAKG